MKKITWIMIVVALALFATACGGGDPTVSTASGAETAPAAATEVPAEPVTEDPEPAPTDEPNPPAETAAPAVEATEEPPAEETAPEASPSEDPAAEAAVEEVPTEEPEAAPVDDGLTIEERAEQSAATLQPNDHPFDYEVLDVSNGTKTTLRDVVDGDRPVLVWFWSPH